jgi:predicted transcriptional regulator of viral defense system
MKKHISYRSSQLLSSLIDQKKEFFTLDDAVNILSGKGNMTVRKLLSDMTKRGIIMRIRGGLYYRIPYEQKPDQYLPNWHLIAEAMVQPKDYYIGFYSALDIHGLITQPSLVEQVVTQEQVKPRTQQVKNVRFEFITLSQGRFFGYKKQWINDFYKIECSDLEKTILDSLYKPGYAGGITEITKALYKGREKFKAVKFLDYLEKYDKQVVYKRLGFIINRLGLFPDLQDLISRKISLSYAPLDPSFPKQGNYCSKWGIIENFDFKTAINSVKT